MNLHDRVNTPSGLGEIIEIEDDKYLVLCDDTNVMYRWDKSEIEKVGE